MRFEALLFDLDGTLVDSHDEICFALEQSLLDLGLDLGFARVKELVDGSPLEVIWDKLLTSAEPPESHVTYEEFACGYRQHYMRDIGHATELFPGVRETLELLQRTHPELRFAVVSNKSAPSVAPLLAKLDIEHFFALALGSGGTPLAPKPDPALLLHASERLACEPARCAMIGDTAFDVLAGRRAGMTTIALSHGMASRDALAEARADHLIHAFPELARIVLG